MFDGVWLGLAHFVLILGLGLGLELHNEIWTPWALEHNGTGRHRDGPIWLMVICLVSGLIPADVSAKYVLAFPI